MKNLKKFENFSEDELIELDQLCKKLIIESDEMLSHIGEEKQEYTINSDGSVDVIGRVNLYAKFFDKIPIKFNRVNGDFFCNDNKLTTLENCPVYIGKNFYCSQNKLTTLLNGPTYVGGKYYECYNNDLKDVYGFPESYRGAVYINNNPVYEIICLSVNNLGEINTSDGYYSKFIYWLNEYHVIRNGNIVIQDRLIEALYGMGYTQKSIERRLKKDLLNYKLI